MSAETPAREVAVDAERDDTVRTPWGRHAMASMLFFVLGAEMFVLSPSSP